MAESSKAHPSLEGIFQVLAQVPRDKLISYKHKLSSARQDWRSSQLLNAMILLTLKREAEARMSLDALRDNPAAAYINQSHWGTAVANTANPIPPKRDAEVGLAVAQIYSLLVDEKLCSPLARDEAYRVAIAAFQSSNVGKDRFKSLLVEASEKCGMDFMSTLRTNNSSLCGGKPGKSPPPRTVSDPVPIQRSSDPQPLRSTGSPTSTVSHLEISQSPTVSFLTHVVHDYSIPKVSKLCGSTSRCPAQGDGEGNNLEPPASSQPKSMAGFPNQGDEMKNERTGHFRHSYCSSADLSGSKNSQLPKEAAQRPAECTEPANAAGKQDPEGLLSQTSSTWPSGSAASTQRPQSSVDDFSSSKPISSPVPSSVSSSAPPPPSSGSSSMDLQTDATEFFTFVVLHASEDETLACQVKDHLESLGVSNGATYNEDFLVPGHSQLSCFQNALDNSAFTLLLLTENFENRFCSYQTSVALMDSFTRFCKTNTVIPFISKERPVKQSEMPFPLMGLVPLDESSPVFAKRVKRTFTPKAIQEKKVAWSYRRQIQERQRLLEQNQNYQHTLQRLSRLDMNAQAAMPLPPMPAGFPGLQVPSGHVPQPQFYPQFPAPGTFQPSPGPDQPSLSQPFLLSLGSGGPQPHLIIQNAQMVQIGDYNHMHVERTNATLGTAEEEGSPDQGVENGNGNRHRD